MSAIEYAPGLERFPADGEHDEAIYRDVIPRIIPVASPAAGADWSVAVPGGAIWQVQAVVATLVTSAVAGNRFTALTVSDGSTTFFRLGGALAIAASTTARESWLRNLGFAVVASAPSGLTTPFPAMPLLGGWLLSSSTTAIDVGDQYSAIALYVYQVEWREMRPQDAANYFRQDWRRQYHHPLLEEIV